MVVLHILSLLYKWPWKVAGNR